MNEEQQRIDELASTERLTRKKTDTSIGIFKLDLTIGFTKNSKQEVGKSRRWKELQGVYREEILKPMLEVLDNVMGKHNDLFILHTDAYSATSTLGKYYQQTQLEELLS